MLVHITLLPREDNPQTYPEQLAKTIVSMAGDEAGSQEAVEKLIAENCVIVPLLHSWATGSAIINCGYDYDPRDIKPAIVDPGDDLANAAIPEKYTLKGMSERLWANGTEGTVDAAFIPAYLTTFGGVKPEDDKDKITAAILLARSLRCLFEGFVHEDVIEAAGLLPLMRISELDTTPAEDADESA